MNLAPLQNHSEVEEVSASPCVMLTFSGEATWDIGGHIESEPWIIEADSRP